MSRPPRADEAGGIYHALNRGNGREAILHKPDSIGSLFAHGRGRFLTAAAMLLLIAAGCDGMAVFKGTVSDKNHAPVAGAVMSVKFHNPKKTLFPDERTTAFDGSFSIMMQHGPGLAEVDLTVKKDGFKDYEMVIDCRKDKKREYAIQLDSK